jgi:hypothetical protein
MNFVRAPLRACASLMALLVLVLFPWQSLSAEAKESAPDSPRVEEKPAGKKVSLDAWRKLKKETEELFEAPQGPERRAKLEAFLKEHPDYPDPSDLLWSLADDYVESGAYDPAHVAQLIERMVEAYPIQQQGSMASRMVESYYLRYGLPLDGADRLLKLSRQIWMREKEDLNKEPNPDLRYGGWVETRESWLLELEGRILLARGDAAGALKKLREADASRFAVGRGLLLRDSQGKLVADLPAGDTSTDWLNLSMAEAYNRLGNRPSALERLARVRNFGGFTDEIPLHLSKLRGELNLPPPRLTEFRADPLPAPEFTLEDLEGKKVSLSDYRGKVILVMFWATT